VAEGITVTRVFDAPRERVWKEWTDPERFADWFGGKESEVPLSSVSMDVRPGGSWRLTMFADLGRREIHCRTEMLFQQRGRLTPEQYEGAAQGWGSFFDRIADRLAET
jgi:uncharacterized protein YndB with AHSA1/START domain